MLNLYVNAVLPIRKERTVQAMVFSLYLLLQVQNHC